MNDNNNFNIENKFINYGTEQKEKKKSKKIIFIILLIILLGIAGYLFYVNKIEKETNKKSNNNYEEYDPNYKVEESNNNSTINSNEPSNTTSNITSNIVSNITSNVTSNTTSNIPNSNSNKTSNSNISSVAVTGVKLNISKLSMTVGETKNLSASIIPNNATNKGIMWSSSDTGVATVDSNGKVIAKKAGTAIITVKTKDGGKKATSTITVKAQTIPVTGISITSSTTAIFTLNSVTAKASITPSNATDKKVTWSSSNNKIATVDQNGKIKGISRGTVTITATTSSGKKATKTYSIHDNPYKLVIIRNATGGGEMGIHYNYGFHIFVGDISTTAKSVTYNGKTITSYSSVNENIINKSVSTATVNFGNNSIYVAPVVYTW